MITRRKLVPKESPQLPCRGEGESDRLYRSIDSLIVRMVNIKKKRGRKSAPFLFLRLRWELVHLQLEAAGAVAFTIFIVAALALAD
jgi:hypothetical protein